MHKGFVSGYFLVMFLTVSTIASGISLCYSYRFGVLENLKIHESYLASESIVIQTVQCNLQMGTLEEGTFENGEFLWKQSLKGEWITISILTPVQEDLYVQIDPVEKIVLSYTCDRYLEK